MKQSIITLFIGLMGIISHIYGITAQEIIQRVDEQEGYETSRATIIQTIATSGGEERSFVIRLQTRRTPTQDILMEYIEPARVRGIRMLFLDGGDEIWTYFPRTGRTRKLASHMRRQKVMGSGFSYEDYSGGGYEKDYRAELLGEEEESGVNCYKLELVPTVSDPSYGRLLIWVEKERFVARRIDFYDKSEKLLKRLTLSDYQEVDGHLTPGRFVMEELPDGAETRMELSAIEFDAEIPARSFTVGNLGR